MQRDAEPEPAPTEILQVVPEDPGGVPDRVDQFLGPDPSVSGAMNGYR
jgi:hypothetical protein